MGNEPAIIELPAKTQIVTAIGADSYCEAHRAKPLVRSDEMVYDFPQKDDFFRFELDCDEWFGEESISFRADHSRFYLS